MKPIAIEVDMVEKNAGYNVPIRHVRAARLVTSPYDMRSALLVLARHLRRRLRLMALNAA